MFFKSSIHLLIYSSVLFIKINCQNYEVRCIVQATAVDQAYPTPSKARKKRFILFPEFINFLDDWRYIHAPKNFIYSIANFYPTKIDTDVLHGYIKDIVRQINLVIDSEIIVTFTEDPGEANFHFHFFDYSKCPTDDTANEATTDGIQIFEALSIYSEELVKQNRYRANGGINIVENDRPISVVKFNLRQKFLAFDDFIYDPVIYTCDDLQNKCEIDFYYVLLHETLHGFGIEVIIYQ